MASIVSLNQDPRFRSSALRKELEKAFPKFKDTNIKTSGLAQHQVVENFVYAHVSKLLGREDDVLTEYLLDALRSSETVDPYQLIEILDPFVGRAQAVEATDALCNFLQSDPLSAIEARARQQQQQPVQTAERVGPSQTGHDVRNGGGRSNYGREREQGNAASRNGPRRRERSPHRARAGRDSRRRENRRLDERKVDRFRRDPPRSPPRSRSRKRSRSPPRRRRSRSRSYSSSSESSTSSDRSIEKRHSRLRQRKDRRETQRRRSPSTSSQSSSSSSSSSRTTSSSSSSSSSSASEVTSRRGRERRNGDRRNERQGGKGRSRGRST